MDRIEVPQEIAAGIVELRKRIDKANIPSCKIDETLLLASWNIREFGKRKRELRSLYYIAEIFWQFDLIALVELRDNLGDLAKVMELLGPYWKVVYSDFRTDAAGNHERIAYVYDKRAVAFTGLAAEANEPRTKDKSTGEYLSSFTWWRSPYMASFRAGDFDFILLTDHARWGDSGDARTAELKELASWVEERKNHKQVEDKDIIVMGDFNIETPAQLKALTSGGLEMPKALMNIKGTNLEQTRRYDQILHYPTFTSGFTNNGGSVDFYQNNFKPLYPGTKKTKQELTYELSDHLPLWVEINVDSSGEQLDQVLNRDK
jgi:hypothetical protein